MINQLCSHSPLLCRALLEIYLLRRPPNTDEHSRQVQVRKRPVQALVCAFGFGFSPRHRNPAYDKT